MGIVFLIPEKRLNPKSKQMANNNGKLIAALLLGAAAGATMGVLFAPDKGSELRRRISGKASEFGEDIANRFSDLKDKVTSRGEELVDKAEKATEKATSGSRNTHSGSRSDYSGRSSTQNPTM
jgi:gas vesicle protein